MEHAYIKGTGTAAGQELKGDWGGWYKKDPSPQESNELQRMAEVKCPTC